MSVTDAASVSDLISDADGVPAPPAPPRWRPGRLTALLLVTALVIVAVATWNLMRGLPELDLAQVWQALWEDDGGAAAFVVRELRLPRVATALLCGAALGVAGTIMQDSLRNPIADPSLLGISQSAALVVALVLLFPGTVPQVGTPLLCLIAGLLTGALLVLFARSVRDPVRLILIGFVLAMLYSTLTEVITLLAPNEGANALSNYYRFEIGSVSGASWDRLAPILPWLVVAFPAALLCGRVLNLLQLGDDVASGLGMRVTRARLMLLFVAVLLVAPAVSVVGPVAFVALISPHVCRALMRTTNAYAVLPASAAVGALTVLLADTAGRLLLFPLEIPAGIWTVVVIGPAAIWLAGNRLRSVRAAEGAG